MANETAGKECVFEIIPWCPDCGERFDPNPHYETAHENWAEECEHCGARMVLETELGYSVRTVKSEEKRKAYDAKCKAEYAEMEASSERIRKGTKL